MSYNELQDWNDSEKEGSEESKNVEESEPQKNKLQENKVVPVTTRSGRIVKIPDRLDL